MSRILIDLPEVQITKLAALAQAEHRPRAAVIREAIEAYIVQHEQRSESSVFGLWKGRKNDGLDYQQALRSEW